MANKAQTLTAKSLLDLGWIWQITHKCLHTHFAENVVGSERCHFVNQCDYGYCIMFWSPKNLAFSIKSIGCGSRKYQKESDNCLSQFSVTRSLHFSMSTKYYCKYCGHHAATVGTLTINSCPYSPTKKHQPYEGPVQSKYTCKFCGYKASTMGTLCINLCSKSPNKHHQPLWVKCPTNFK